MTGFLNVKLSLDKGQLERALKKSIANDKTVMEAWAGFNEDSGVRHITEEEKKSNAEHHDQYFKDASYVDIARRAEFGVFAPARPFLSLALEHLRKGNYDALVAIKDGGIDWKQTVENIAKKIAEHIDISIIAGGWAHVGKRTYETKGKNTPLEWTGGLRKAVRTRTKIK